MVDPLELARQLGQQCLERSVLRQLDALDAVG